MPKVGEIAFNGMRFMTPRTKKSVEDTTAEFSRLRNNPEKLAPEYLDDLVASMLFYHTDDVLAQCIADGYEPTQEGVL